MLEILTDKDTGNLVSIAGKEPFVLSISDTEMILSSAIDKVIFPLTLPIGKPTVETTDPKYQPVQSEWVTDLDGHMRAKMDGRDLSVWPDGDSFGWQVSESGTSYISSSKTLEDACRAAEEAIGVTRGTYTPPPDDTEAATVLV